MDGRIDKWIHACMDEITDRRIDGWIDGWTGNGWSGQEEFNILLLVDLLPSCSDMNVFHHFTNSLP